MKDPYEVLGVQRNATEEEIKTAYKNMARKYHPDNYHDNPLADLAEERMKEINEAYDAIMASKKGRSSRNSGANQSNYSGSSEFSDIRNLISANRLEEAQELLDGVSVSNRSAEWYFLNGSVLYRRGWFDDAYTSFSTACRMDPANPEYRAALQRISSQRNGHMYGGPYRTSGSDCSMCDMCMGALCLDSMCRCMGGC